MLLVKRKKRNKSYGYKSKSKKQYTRKKRYNYQDKVECIKIVRIILVIAIILSLLIGVGIPLYGSPTLSNMALLSCPKVKFGPGDSARSHTADEYIHIHEIEQAIKLLKKLLIQN